MDAAGTLNTAPSVSSQYFVSSASYFLGIGDVGIQSIQVGSLTSLLDHSGKLFMALACL